MCILFFVLCYKFIAKNGGLINLKNSLWSMLITDPGSMSLTQIYGTFNRAMLQVASNLRAYSDLILMLYGKFYTMSQVREREENF